MKKAAINGFGRIGRILLRTFQEKEGLDIVAISNRTADPKILAHLLKYDSVHGTFKGDISATSDAIIINGKKIPVFSASDVLKLPWKDLEIDILLECSGKYRDADEARKHIDAGAKKILISAPAKKVDATLLYGVNHEAYDPAKHYIISAASCTTTCLATICKALIQKFNIQKGIMTTVHAYTNDQKILDGSHKDLRRARAAGLSIIPTTTGAATAVGEVLPELKGKLDGIALRVPTANVSVVDLTVDLDRETTKDEVNALIKEASESKFKGLIRYCDEPLVSCDFNGDSHSAIFDADSTYVKGNMVKILAWYDNEWGYSCRMRDLAIYMANKF
ncbi:MAG: type I glyceraldehyde-3-phosphate dehydrogenase [Proteobacteria bacterium]|nr:type I glyceraldehyde-3-phosphate dehydrogenase [Pseudomonadota bacterium]